MHNVQRKHGLLSPTSLCSCLRINTSFFFFFFLNWSNQQNEGAQRGNLCIWNTFTPPSTHGWRLGVRVQFTATPRRAVDDRFCLFPFLQRSESDGVRHQRGNFGGSAVLFFLSQEGASATLHTVHLAFPLSRDTLGHEGGRTITCRGGWNHGWNTTSVTSSNLPKKSISSQVFQLRDPQASLFLACEAHSGDFSAPTERYCTRSASVATVTPLRDCIQNKIN